MIVMIIGSALALSSIFLMQSSESLIIYAGMLMLILGIFLIKIGRDKTNQKL
jgi:hypothetical protein